MVWELRILIAKYLDISSDDPAVLSWAGARADHLTRARAPAPKFED